MDSYACSSLHLHIFIFSAYSIEVKGKFGQVNKYCSDIHRRYGLNEHLNKTKIRLVFRNSKGCDLQF
jgi:hypothetical protein